MNNLKKELLETKNKLTEAIAKAERNPILLPGSLRLSRNKGETTFYQHFPQKKKQKTKEKYIPKTDVETARQLAQQDYDREFLEKAKKQLAKVDRLLKQYEEYELENLYRNLHPARKALVKPHIPDIDEWLEKWLNQQYPPGIFEPGLPVILSNKGDRVRSKSEKIIADAYYRFEIPYLYEPPLELHDRNKRYVKRPDFAVYHRLLRKIYYHEHLGRLDDPGYIARNLDKLDLYHKNGIILGDNLILTFETSTRPFDSHQLDDFLNQYFRDILPR